MDVEKTTITGFVGLQLIGYPQVSSAAERRTSSLSGAAVTILELAKKSAQANVAGMSAAGGRRQQGMLAGPKGS
jgi:hypothetical protein